MFPHTLSELTLVTSRATLVKRLSSTSATTSITIKSTPSKDHFHAPVRESTLPKGYLLTGLYSGIKKQKPDSEDPLDVALVLSTSSHPTSAAACFTLNAFRAAPVVISREVLQKNGGRARAVVVNSGCANAVTGKKGIEDAWEMVKAGDALLASHGLRENVSGETAETLVMSTGVIGVNLPISKILSAISTQRTSSLPSYTLSPTPAAYDAAARAFMTTDTFPKLRARTFEINGKAYRMAGMDKGAGMIHPQMGDASSSGGLVHASASAPASASSAPPAAGLHATLLGLILTDAPVSPKSLQSALTYAVERSFNSISVDGDMSTNDTVVAMANGAGVDASAIKVAEIDERTDPEAYVAFREHLTSFAIDLAKLVVRDGEGATKFVGVCVQNAATYADAHRVASKISTSALVKTALYGEDANWGRILSSTGSTPLSIPLDPTLVSVSFVPSPTSSNPTPLLVLENGEPVGVDEERASEILGEEEFEIRVDLGGQGVGGNEAARYWTCDFSYEYVRINGDYRS
ncbi:arginine biosynthesis protein ArgJ [Paxillus ammoniavirescens]|nr:arginine biosynthesis protein ArgJ [Paxillus ammoniavirescens]